MSHPSNPPPTKIPLRLITDPESHNYFRHLTSALRGLWEDVNVPKYSGAKTASYTLVDTDNLIEYTSGSYTATLPTAVGRKGKEYQIVNSGSGTITVATTLSQTINGTTTKSLSQYDAMKVMSTGSGWIII